MSYCAILLPRLSGRVVGEALTSTGGTKFSDYRSRIGLRANRTGLGPDSVRGRTAYGVG
jgi:hypothetical protein